MSGEAKEHLNKSLSLWRTLGDPWGTPLTLNNRGLVLLREGRADDALKDHEEALRIQLEEGDIWGGADSLHYLGEVALELEEYAEAELCFRSSLARQKAVARPQIQLDCLLGLARVEGAARPLTKEAAGRAARMLGTWQCEADRANLVLTPHHPEIARMLKQRLRKLLDDRFALEWETGRKTSLKETLQAVFEH